MVTAPVASANPPWPLELSMDVPGITTTLDGDVVVSECYAQSHSRGYWSQTFNGFGQQIGSVENTGQSNVEACGFYGMNFVGRDNRRISHERTTTNPTHGVIAGYEDDQQIWSYVPSTSCSSGVRGVQRKGVAGNGATAYVVISNGCGSNPMLGGLELIGLSMATGSVQFQVAINNYDVQPYLNGYVYYTSGSGFTYLNASGAVESMKGYSTGNVVTSWSLGANGELAFLYRTSWGSGCTQYLVLRNANGTQNRTLSPSSGCMYQTVHATPTGGAAVAGYANYMYLQDFSLIDETSTPPVKKVSAATTTSASVKVDVKGNLLATDGTGVSAYSAMGLLVRRENYADHLPALSSVSFEAKTAFANGDIYMVGQQYPHGSYDPDGYPTYVARVTASEIGIDYPRGTFLGDTSNPAEPFIEYVALGDSFSAGEGIPAFDSGTDNPGVNECHRNSTKAYGPVLAQSEGYTLTAFAACSGAVADRLTSVWTGTPQEPNLNTNELAQRDHVTADTDLITMTIGGNDVPFEEYAEACISPLSPAPCDGQAKTDALAGITNNVIPEVQANLSALSTHLNTIGSDAVVLVIGYPYLVPKSVPANEPLQCSWLNPGELEAIREVTDELNTAIKDEVDKIFNNFHFVTATDEVTSPFVGHELCREDADPNPSFFNDYTGNPSDPQEYIAHPNKAGQAAYADLVKNWIVTNPAVFQ
jgi:lysophospholipase L1-like esterase